MSNTPTEDAVLREPAGRKLDAWVWCHALYRDPPLFDPYSSPYYAHCIEDAWEVIHRLQHDWSEVHLSHSPRGWRCLVADAVQRRGYVEAVADTAPLAICRCAVIAALRYGRNESA